MNLLSLIILLLAHVYCSITLSNNRLIRLIKNSFHKTVSIIISLYLPNIRAIGGATKPPPPYERRKVGNGRLSPTSRARAASPSATYPPPHPTWFGRGRGAVVVASTATGERGTSRPRVSTNLPRDGRAGRGPPSMCGLDRNALPGTSTACARLVFRGGWFRPIAQSGD
jgi:hypothetical protein